MAVIRHISIQNFRAVRQAEWCPGPSLNCLIGPGDSGKSTIIDAIDWCLAQEDRLRSVMQIFI